MLLSSELNSLVLILLLIKFLDKDELATTTAGEKAVAYPKSRGDAASNRGASFLLIKQSGHKWK